ncbi:discoidin domain-containing receptor tyrosine kinase B-like [Aphis craccivora]|uniref:Discoidin domain-containing receptor tyrosine kinase B-like n=1 Tax=Aphis craccivora TaxID=307492 RepID=A0A6G0ZAB0_APHCR|nr:discoidin domain-containing receptor tyrosine kinase B-like [Aphis craccivora]
MVYYSNTNTTGTVKPDLLSAGFFPLPCIELSVHEVIVSQCMSALGMQSGMIKDEDLTASSSFEIGNVGPQNASINPSTSDGIAIGEKNNFAPSYRYVHFTPTLFFYCRRSNTLQKYTFRPPFKDPQDTFDTSIKAQVV